MYRIKLKSKFDIMKNVIKRLLKSSIHEQIYESLKKHGILILKMINAKTWK